jgi:hypothetical protein
METDAVAEMLCSLEYWMMDKAKNPLIASCIPWLSGLYASHCTNWHETNVASTDIWHGATRADFIKIHNNME